MDELLLYRLWLTIGLGPANRRINQLLDKYLSPDVIFQILQSGTNPGLTAAELRNLKSVTLSQVEYLFKSCTDSGIEIISADSDAYPGKLLEIDNPPNILFSYGSPDKTHVTPSVAIIGARDADDYALTATEQLSYELSAQGITIISGFARGIDSAAHRGALSAKGQTVAVLGCGIGYDYPRNSRNLKRQIAQNGAVLSEYFPSSVPARENFKIRNRIVSGLADGIVVIQAGERSGTLNTVSHGLTQGKDIFVLPPHDIFSEHYRGNIGLLRDGAIPVYSSKDIINHLAGL